MDGTMVIVGPNYPQLEMGDQDPECVIGEPVRRAVTYGNTV